MSFSGLQLLTLCKNKRVKPVNTGDIRWAEWGKRDSKDLEAFCLSKSCRLEHLKLCRLLLTVQDGALNTFLWLRPLALSTH